MSSPSLQEKNHIKRNVAIVAIVVAGLVIGVVYVAGFVFGLSGCFGGYGCYVSTTASCDLQSKSCQIVVSEKPADFGFVASACLFDVAKPNSAGILSNSLGGPPMNISLNPGSSITVYCSGYQGTPEPGGQVVGAVQFTNSWEIQFNATWS